MGRYRLNHQYDNDKQYLKITNKLLEYIAAGALKSGDKLPSERELCDVFNTTRTTVRESLSLLEANGLIHRQDRRGWFVTAPRLVFNPTENTNFHEMVASHKRSPRTQLLSGTEIQAPIDIITPLALKPFQLVYQLKRVRYADDRAICYCENYCLPDKVPNLLTLNLNGSLTEIYQQHFSLLYTKMHLSFYPTAMPIEAAKALGTNVGVPALCLQRLNYDQHGDILDFDIEYWLHDSIKIEVTTLS